MFDSESRYQDLPTLVFQQPDGRVVPYVSRRFVPQGEEMPLLQEVTVELGDRLDIIATRTLGAPEQYWRIADANNTMNPVDLTLTPGLVLRIPVPYPQSMDIQSSALDVSPNAELTIDRLLFGQGR